MAQYPPPPPPPNAGQPPPPPPYYANTPQTNVNYGYYYGYPAYGAQMTYEQMIAHRNAFRQQQIEFQNKRLKEALPSKYVMIHGAIVFALGLLQIAFQAVLLRWSKALFLNYSGIWAGSCFVIAAVLAIFLIMIRVRWFFFVVQILHMICFFLGFTQMGMNIVNTTRNCTSWSSIYCSDYHGFYIGMVIAGMICAVMCLVFFILMFNFINGLGCFNSGSQVAVNYNTGNNAIYQPNNLQAQNQYLRPAY